MMDVVWKRILHPEILDIYEISSTGLVRNMTTGNILHYCNPDHNGGYCRIMLKTKSGKNKKFSIHRLVMGAFSEDPRLFDIKKFQVHHKDSNKTNNNINNLDIVTPSENTIESVKFHKKYCGNKDNAVLSDDEAHIICKMMEDGYSNITISNALNISDKTHRHSQLLSSIRAGVAYKEISKLYNIPAPKVYKTYDNDIMHNVALLVAAGYKPAFILKFLDLPKESYRGWVKHIYRGHMHRDVVKYYKQQSSTTIENSRGEIILTINT